MTQIYGIKNCDTMKKAIKWLEEQKINFTFHDYKKEGAKPDIIKKAITQHGWENVINRRGTTWRNLSESEKNTMDDNNALETAIQNPSIIKRPLLIHKDKIYLGFKAETFEQILS